MIVFLNLKKISLVLNAGEIKNLKSDTENGSAETHKKGLAAFPLCKKNKSKS